MKPILIERGAIAPAMGCRAHHKLCADGDTLAMCVEGRWQLSDCSNACGDKAARCDALADPPMCTCPP